MLVSGRGDTLGHTFSRNYVHVIFGTGTKDRRKTITQELQTRLWAYLAGIGKNHDIGMLAVGGTGDHVHILLHLPHKIPLAKAVLLLKSNSSKWMNEVTEFSWQEGYGDFSVNASNLEAVIRCVRNRQKHYRQLGFEEELRAILQKHGVAHHPRASLGISGLWRDGLGQILGFNGNRSKGFACSVSNIQASPSGRCAPEKDKSKIRLPGRIPGSLRS